MMRRTFCKLAATAPAAVMASPVGAEAADPMAQLVLQLFRLREEYDLIPDPDGYINTPAHKEMDARMSELEAEIEARPIIGRDGLAAYCRYLAVDAEYYEVEPKVFSKVIDWALSGQGAARPLLG